jgi:hypothetical protein
MVRTELTVGPTTARVTSSAAKAKMRERSQIEYGSKITKTTDVVMDCIESTMAPPSKQVATLGNNRNRANEPKLSHENS